MKKLLCIAAMLVLVIAGCKQLSKRKTPPLPPSPPGLKPGSNTKHNSTSVTKPLTVLKHLPTDFAVDSIKIQQRTNVVLTWINGTPPFQVQAKTNIMDGWRNYGPSTSQRSITNLAQSVGKAFFRVVSLAGTDITRPTVSIGAPANGSTVSGSIPVVATVSDNIGVVKVQYSLNNNLTIGASTSDPFNISYDTALTSNGANSFQAFAFDAAGNFGVANSTVTVSNFIHGQLQWSKIGNTTAGAGVFPFVAARSSNVVLAGSFISAVDFGSGVLTSAGGQDAFMVKFNTQGAVLWQKRFGSTTGDKLRNVTMDSQGNIIVTGEFSGTVDFGGTTLVSVPPSVDGFIAKYSTSGSLIWVKAFGGEQVEFGNAVAVDGNDSIYFSGVLQSSNIVFGNITLTNAGGYDLILSKLSPQGSVVWAKRFGGVNFENPTAISVDRSGGLLLSGVWGGGDLGGGSTVPSGAFVAKYSAADGVYQWSKVPGARAINGVSTAPNGNVVITGSLSGPLDFGTGPTVSGGIFLASYTTAGVNTWAKTFNFDTAVAAGDAGNALSVDGNGNIAFTGTVFSTVNFGGGSVNGTSGGSYFLVGFTSAGSYRWLRMASSGQSNGGSICFDEIGNVAVAGGFLGTSELGGFTGTTQAGFQAAFTAKYGP